MVTPEMPLFLAGRMGLINPQTMRGSVYIVRDDFPPICYEPHNDNAQFGGLVVWAAMQGLEPDFSHGIVRVWPIGKDYPCAEENDSTPDSIRAAAVVAVCRALGWEEGK